MCLRGPQRERRGEVEEFAPGGARRAPAHRARPGRGRTAGSTGEVLNCELFSMRFPGFRGNEYCAAKESGVC